MSPKSFIIVGAGMGGLAVALRLAHKGHHVTVLEKTELVGGRNRPVQVNDCHFDGGPTLLMMMDPFRKLFTDVGESIDNHLSLQRLDPSYRVFYRDGMQIEGTPDSTRMRAQIREHFGEQDAEGFTRLMKDLKSMYEEAIPRFVRRNFYSPVDFFGGDALPIVMRHKMLRNLYSGVSRYVRNPKLRMLFSFQSMYLGLSPFEAPWVYAVLTHMEFGEGIWFPQGGLRSIATKVAELAQVRGAEIRVNAEVASIEGNRVTLTCGEQLTADAVIINADLPYAERELLAEPKPRARKLSCSGLVLYVDYHGSLPKLLHHNVFFGNDFKENLDQIFTRSEIPTDPAFYAAISARSDTREAPVGHENLFLLAPCPNLSHSWSEDDLRNLKSKMFQRLAAEADFDETNVVAWSAYQPTDYRDELNLEGGAAFGISHHFLQSAYFRPGNRSKLNPYAYFVGASTTPGNGLPMVLISAELLEDRLERDLTG